MQDEQCVTCFTHAFLKLIADGVLLAVVTAGVIVLRRRGAQSFRIHFSENRLMTYRY